MTLREITDLSGVTRRAVQVYEKHGLVAPITKNKYGHLLYDESALELIKKIKLFQKFGYSLSEIELLMRASNDVLKISLQKKLDELVDRLDETGELISKLEQMISEL